MMIAALAFVSIIAVSAVSIADDSEASPVIEYEGVFYELYYDDNYAEVCEAYIGTYSGNVKIADTVTYDGHTLPVTTIGYNAFYGCTGLTSVDLGNVTTIDDYAFYGCTGLTSVDLKNVGSIERYAFYGCTGLTSIDLKNVTSVGDGAFEGCTGMTSVDLTNVTTVKYSAFYGCTSLTEFKVNTSNTAYSVIDGVLFNKTGTELIQYPAAKSGPYTVPNSVERVEYNAFNGCTSLTSVDLGNATSIGMNTFKDCTGLTSVDLRNVETIERYAFNGCTSLTSVDLKNVTTLAYEVFIGCTSLTEFKVNSSNTVFSVKDGVLFTKSNNNLRMYPAAKQGSYTVPDGTTHIFDYAFEGCIGLTSVDLNNVITFGTYIFKDCTKLTSVDLRNYADVLDNHPFFGCTGLTEFKVNDINDTYSVKDGVLLNKTGTELILFPAAKSESYALPKDVTSIGDRAFYKCTSLKSVDLNEVTSIGESAFEGCTGLTSMDLKNVTSIGGDAFYDCTGLTEFKVNSDNTTYSVIDGALLNKTCTELILFPAAKSGTYTLPDGVTSIPKYAFEGCTGLTSVDLGNVTSIGNYAFNGCTGLTEFKVNSNNTAYSVAEGVLFNKAGTELILCPAAKSGSYTLPDKVTSVGEDAFEGCTGLTSVDLKNVTSVSDGAFEGCTGLTSVDLTNVTTIDYSAFRGCTGLTSVDLKNVTDIESDAFRGCTGLLAVSLPDNPPTIGSSPFSECPSEMKMLVKESAALTNYQSNADWQPYVKNIAVGKSIADTTVDPIPDQTYTGSAIEPTITVKDGATTLVKGTDYTVAYSDNVNAGTATVTITGIGDYAGTKTVTFTITAAQPSQSNSAGLTVALIIIAIAAVIIVALQFKKD